MIFDSHDTAFLRLCGLCRYLPCDLKNRYENPVFYKNVAGNLLAHGLIKLMPDERSVKLTRLGNKILADMGYEYPQDARQKSSGNSYKRRLVSAHMNILLHCAGIDVFADTLQILNESAAKYIPSLTLRSNTKSKALAGTRFLGLLRMADTVFIPYYIDNYSEGIFPGYEDTTIKNHVDGLAGIARRKVLLAGETLEIILSELSNDKVRKVQKGLKPYSTALKILNLNICLTTFTRCGILQLSIMSLTDYRVRIAEAIGEGFHFGHNTASEYSHCDGIYKTMTSIVAVDMDLTRISAAIEESAALGKPANIICLGDQREALQQYANTLPTANIQKFYSLRRENIQRIFPEMKLLPEEMQPYRTEKGDLVKVNEMGKTIYC